MCIGCSWSRFDDLEKDTPVVLLKRPGALRTGFASSLSVVQSESGARVLVGGLPGTSTAALFELGLDEAPAVDAISAGYCRSQGTDLCFLAAQPAAIGVAPVPGDESWQNCFAVGVSSEGSGPSVGIGIECQDQLGDPLRYSLKVPEPLRQKLEASIGDRRSEPVVMASSSAEPRALLVGSPHLGSAWFYGTVDSGAQPVLLDPPTDPGGEYGASVSIVPLGDREVLAVGAPKSGFVHLFGVDADQSPRYLGCLGSKPGFGRALGAGRVTRGDAPGELLISEEGRVHVFSAGPLLQLEGTGPCTLDRLPQGSSVATLSCQSSSREVTGCETSDFGHSLAVGDFDGDGDGEIAVGAPGARVRGVDAAGAVLVFDLESPSDTSAADLLFLSSAESHDLLGSALGVAQLRNRQIPVAAARGNAKVALFYCPELPNAPGGTRCR